MPSFIPQPGETHEVDLRDLADHPLLASIPTWPRDCAEFASLKDSIAERGLDYDILVTTAFEIVDGRNRRNAIATLGHQRGCRRGAIRCRFVDQADAASIIVATLGNRRHLTKGALAYLLAPMFDAVIAESKERRVRNLPNVAVGKVAAVMAGQAVAPESPLSGLSAAKTAEEVAAQMGLGRSLYMQALQLHRMFVKAGAEVRAKYEPRLLGPWQDEHGEWHEPVGLGYMINGITAILENKAEENLGKRNEHDRLFLGNLGKLSLHWDSATPEQRAQIKGKLFDTFRVWPAELVEQIAAVARKAASEQAKQTVGA